MENAADLGKVRKYAPQYRSIFSHEIRIGKYQLVYTRSGLVSIGLLEWSPEWDEAPATTEEIDDAIRRFRIWKMREVLEK